MFRNYLTIAFRNLQKRKLYSFINIFGLATGVAVCLVILKYVDFQLSYDDFHSNSSNIYRTITASYRNGEFLGKGPTSGYAQVLALKNDIPEIKTYLRTHPMYGGGVISNKDTGGEPRRFREENIQFVDSTFFDVFSYQPVHGNLETCLDHPSSIVITESMRRKYFGNNEDPTGRTMNISAGWVSGDFQVTAVIRDVPENSHFSFDFLVTIHDLLQGEQYKRDDGWGWSNFVSYVVMYANTDPKTVEAKMPEFIKKYRGEQLAQSSTRQELLFQPIRDIHLSPGMEIESSPTISPTTIYFFTLISVFILAIAWVNYINLSTARAMERAREVGIKKAVGAFRSQLIMQFIFESFLVNFLAVVLAMIIAILLLPLLGDILDKSFTFDFTDKRLWFVLTGLFLAGSLISGAYPAFILSSFKTAAVLKGSTEKMGGFSLRQALVVFQFVSSLVLIAGTFAIYRQLMFMRNQDKGFDMEQMLVINGPSVFEEGEGREERLISFKNGLKNLSSVKHVASSATIPGGGFNWGTGMRKDGTEREASKSGNVTWVDRDFIETYGMEFVTGKVWEAEMTSNFEYVIVNEAAVATLGLGDVHQALEERIILGDDTVNILGVLKNYHWNSLKTAYEPILLAPSRISRRNFSIRLNTTSMQAAVAQVEKLFMEAFPGNPFDYYFLDDFFDRQYKDEQQFAKIFSLFAMLAIIIACLGLWGLASFTTTQKLQEISIRKVLGATTGSIITLLSSRFMKLVLVSSIIALPLIWFGIDKWLKNFAFHINVEWDLLVVPCVVLGLVALCTVSIQILRGANSNPAKILRAE